MSQQRRHPQRSERAQAGHLGLSGPQEGEPREGEKRSEGRAGEVRAVESRTGPGVGGLPAFMFGPGPQGGSQLVWVALGSRVDMARRSLWTQAGKVRRAVCPARRRCPACPMGHTSSLCSQAGPLGIHSSGTSEPCLKVK